MQNHQITEDDAQKRLDVYVSTLLGAEFPRSAVQSFILEEKILVNGKSAKASYKLRNNDNITIADDLPKKSDVVEIFPQDIKLDIIFEDDYLIVINKPKNMLTHPTAQNTTNTLVNGLMHHTKKLSDIGGNHRKGIVHRLDKNTSGLMVVAKNNDVHIKLQEQIKTRNLKRKYLAVVHGVISADKGTIDKPLLANMNKTVKMSVSFNQSSGKQSITHFRVLERYDRATFIELELDTGRTHQIRAHMSSIGHPVFNDTLYGSGGFKTEEIKRLKTNEQVLMSYYIGFTHPVSNEIMNFELAEDKYHHDLKKVLNFYRT